jgi:hypothetical protein
MEKNKNTQFFSNDRGIFIDPNYKNENVQIEDLSIEVDLSVYERNRTHIKVTEDSMGDVEAKTIATMKSGKAPFNQGREFGTGNYSFTTDYTRVSDPDYDGKETLGIESVDIEFNSSYMPMINIELTDVRGKLFQMGKDSPYASFFNFPYPLFELKIKGFYGKPVVYLLHLTKFNTKLDSGSGNFKITCNFVGYTYAYLSDMLLGYMKAIPYTQVGQMLLKKRDDEGAYFVTFKQLYEYANNLNDKIKSLKNGKEAKALSAAHDVLHRYQEIKNRIRFELTSLDKDNFDTKNLDNQMVLIRFENDGNLKYFFNDGLGEILKDVKNLNNKTLTGETYDFDVSRYSRKDGFNAFENLEKKNFIDDDGVIRDKYAGPESFFKSNDKDFKYIARKIKMVDSIMSDECRFHLIYLKDILEDIDTKSNQLTKDIEEKQRVFAQNHLDDVTNATILNEDGEEMNFDFNLYNYTKVLADHVDLLMESIKHVAGEAEKNSTRNSDLKHNAEFIADIPKIAELEKIYAFPGYQLKSEDKDSENSNVFMDAWIGKDHPNIDEAVFVRDLYNGLIEAKKLDNDIAETQLEHPIQWYSVNPFDTGLFTNYQNVWDKVGNARQAQKGFMRLMIMRALIFMNVTVREPSEQEIIVMAQLEANNLFNAIEDDTMKNAIARIGDTSKVSSIVDTIRDNVIGGDKFFINELSPINENRIIAPDERRIEGWADWKWGKDETTTFEEYVYIGGNDSATTISGLKDESGALKPGFRTYLPLFYNGNSDQFDGNSLITSGEGVLTTHEERIAMREMGNIFFSDYLGSVSKDDNKPDDGATYIEFKTLSEYDGQVAMPSYGDTVFSKNKKIDYESKVWEVSELADIKNNLKNVLYNGNWNSVEFLQYKVGDTTYPFAHYFYHRPDFADNLPKIEFHTASQIDVYQDRIEKKYNKGGNMNYKNYSLFGSFFYNIQGLKSRAFLFLQSLPFKKSSGSIINGLIRPLLDNKAATIQVPYAWILYIGGLLARKDDFDFVKTGTETLSFLPLKKIYKGGKDDMLTIEGTNDYANNKLLDHGYSDNIHAANSPFDNILDKLPESVKQKFKDEFYNWASNEGGFGLIRDYLEIFQNNILDGRIEFLNIARLWVDNPTSDIALSNPLLNGNINKSYASVSRRRDSKKRLDEVRKLQSDGDDMETIVNKTVGSYGTIFNFDVEMIEDGDGEQILKDFMQEKRMFINGTWRIWVSNSTNGTKIENTIEGNSHPFTFTKDNMDKYLIAFMKEFAQLKKKHDSIESSIQAQVFNNTNLEEIYLTIYKNIKSVYDKWITGHSQGMTSFKNLIDSFNFIDRGYNNIGSKFKLNPVIIKNLLESSYSNSFYSHIGKVLSNNNFDFIPMPNFVKMNNKAEMENLFKPYNYNTHDNAHTSSFVCMYSGEKSSVLAENENYKDDSFTIEDKDGLPEDFKQVPGILVNYADENQSIFKSIELDQIEFSETNESINVTDQIANSYNNVNSVGQNIFDVYNNRAYNASVGMMGNAMMQPFMYFQLNNIPMFRGSYVVTKVNHSIQPNYMDTVIKGNRVRRIKTKLIDKEAIFYSLIGSFSEIDSADGNLDDLRNIKSSGLSSDSSNSVNTYNYDSGPYYYTFTRTVGKTYNFDIKSNTQKKNSNGTLTPMTYTEIFDEVSKITGVPVTTLKTLSVVESSIGQYGGEFFKNNYMNSLGYVGLMQFHKDATVDVEKSINRTLREDINISDYKFKAIVDVDGRKIIKPTEWSADPVKNNPETNSMFDDFINTLAAAYYAKIACDSLDSSYGHITNIYLSHQQGVGGLKTILANPVNQFENNVDIHPSGIDRNMNNNLPKTYDHTKASYTYQEWYLAWAGHVEAIAADVDGDFQMVVGGADDNDKLSPHFHLKHFTSKDGAKMPADVLANLKELCRNLEIIREYFGNKPIEVTSGYRSKKHNNNTKGAADDSQHIYGRAADIKIQGYTPEQMIAGILKLISEGKISEGGLGWYHNRVHYDIRGSQARWYPQYWVHTRGNKRNFDPSIDDISFATV